MNFQIKLPYSLDDFKKLSFKMMDNHYNGHHKIYDNNIYKYLKNNNDKQGLKAYGDNNILYLNILLEKFKLNNDTFNTNQCSQIINHNIFFESLSPEGQYKEGVYLKLDRILELNGGFKKIANEILNKSKKVFGSGWLWVYKDNNDICITLSKDGADVYHLKDKILFNIDLWEHSFSMDYGCDRLKYVEDIINNYINWDMINKKLS